MDKIEYKEKLDEINHLAEEGDFAGAVEVVDTIDWRHVKSARTLCMVGEIYEANKRFDDAVRVLKYAYKRSSGSKTVVYRLAELSLRYGDTAAARGYAREFAELSPNDAARFALDYKIKRAEGSSLDEQIRVLEEMKEREYTERWSYELARLYMKNGQEDKCVETCDDMILWFAEGKYVQKAMELKKQIRPLTPAQQMKYEAMTGQTPVSTPEPVQEEPAQDNRKPAQIVSEAIDKMDSAAAKAIPEDRAPSSARVNVRRGEGRETFASNANKDQLADSIRAVFSGLQQPAPTLNTDIEMTEQFSDADVDAYIAGKSDNMAQYRVRSLEPESIAEGAVKTDMPEEEDGRQMTFDDYRKPVAEVDLSALFAETKDALAGEIASGVFEKTGVVEEEVPEVEETPVVEEAPVVAEAPIVEEAPVVEEAPIVEEAPVVEEAPIVEEAPVVEETPIVEEVPIVEEAPVVEEAPIVEEAAEVEEAPVVEETQVYEDTPVIEGLPDDEVPSAAAVSAAAAIVAAAEAAAAAGYELPGSEPAQAEPFIVDTVPAAADPSLGLTREFDFNGELQRALDNGVPMNEAVSSVSAMASAEAAAATESSRPMVDVTQKIPAELLASEEELAAESRRSGNITNLLAMDEEGGASEVSRSIIDDIMEKPEVFETVPVEPRRFDDVETKVFSYFAPIPGVAEQVTQAIADVHNNAGDKTSRSGNILVVGRQGSGKTRLADALILAICKDLKIEGAKVAHVDARDFNKKNAAEVVSRLAGGFLVIEGAGALDNAAVENLSQAMNFRTDDLVVILEDEKQDLNNLLAAYPEFADKFTSRITVPVFTNDELVTFGKTYTKEKGYKMDEMCVLALYTMIGDNQKDREPVTVGKVQQMIDQAIARAEKGSRKLGRKFSRKEQDNQGRIILHEKDFDF